MSKILNALNDLQKTKGRKYTKLIHNKLSVRPFSPAGSEEKPHRTFYWSNIVLIAAVAVLCVYTIYSNRVTMNEVRYAKESSGEMMKVIETQERMIHRLTSSIKEFQSSQENRHRELISSVRDLNDSTQDKANQLSVIKSDVDMLSQRLFTLKRTDQALQESLLAIDDQLATLKNSTREIVITEMENAGLKRGEE